jgi:hypothetical protein
MKNRTFLIAAILGIGLLNFSCRHDKTDISTFKDVCFDTEVLPIFKNNCALSGCHNAGGGESGFVLDSYSGIKEGISPGDPLNSEIYKVITNEWINMMPPDNPLSKDQRTTIRLWIEQGALETSCTTSK